MKNKLNCISNVVLIQPQNHQNYLKCSLNKVYNIKAKLAKRKDHTRWNASLWIIPTLTKFYIYIVKWCYLIAPMVLNRCLSIYAFSSLKGFVGWFLCSFFSCFNIFDFFVVHFFFVIRGSLLRDRGINLTTFLTRL